MLVALVIACGIACGATIVAIPVYRLVELLSDLDFRMGVMALPKYVDDNGDSR